MSPGFNTLQLYGCNEEIEEEQGEKEEERRGKVPSKITELKDISGWINKNVFWDKAKDDQKKKRT